MSELKSLADKSVVSINDFYPRHERDKACLMYQTIIAYIAAEFDWKPVIESKLLCARTLTTYMKDEVFRAKLDSLGPVQVAIAQSVYAQGLTQAPWPERIKCADRITAAYRPELFDPGTRREIARAKGNMLETAFKRLKNKDIAKKLSQNVPVSSQPIDNTKESVDI